MRVSAQVLLVVLGVGLLAVAGPAPTVPLAARVRTPPLAALAVSPAAGSLSVDQLPPAVRRAVLNAPYEARPAGDGFRVTTAAYEADFNANGTTFTARGSADTKPGRWQFRLVALERGAVRVPQRPVAPVAEDNVVSFRRPGVVERYVADGRGIEQVFVLDKLPAGTGDVELVGQVGSPLSASLREGAVEYRDPAFAPIDYGKPVAFDARGQALAVSTRVGGAELRLRLDGVALATATLPVTVDPIIRPATQTYADADAGKTDVAYSIARAEFGVVFSAATPTGRQIRFKRFYLTGSPVANSVAITAGDGVSDDNPSVANCRQYNEYYLVWQRFDSGAGTTTVHGRRLDLAGNLKESEMLLSAATGTNSDPDVVAVGPGPSWNSQYMVVWRARTGAGGLYEAWGERVHAGGTHGDVKLSETGGSVGPPRLAFDPVAFGFFTVWSQDGQIDGRGVEDQTGTNQAVVMVTTGAPDNPRGPDVAFDAASRQYLVAWTDDRGTNDGHIYGQLLASGTPAKVGTNFLIDENTGTYPGSSPAVTAEPGGFIVLYDYLGGGTGSATNNDTDVYGAYVRANGTVSLSGIGDVYQDAGVAPVNNDYQSSLATAGPFGFTFAAWNHEITADGANTAVWVANLSGHYTRYVHGKSASFGGGSDGADYWIYRPATGTWFLKGSGNLVQASATWGAAGDIPVLMDYDNDGQGDPGVYRPSNGTWYILDEDALSTQTQKAIVQFGVPGDIPVPGDYVGSTHDDYAVWRPWRGEWFIRDGETGASIMVTWGMMGDVPVPADHDGDGKKEIGVFRPANGTWYTRELDGTNYQAVAWGTAGDIPLPGNYVGSAAADYVVFRPSNGTWYIRDRATGAVTIKQWGTAGDVAMPLDRDADGYLNLAVWRVTNGRWYVLDSNYATFVTVDWGTAGDIPASGARNGG